MSQSFLHGLAAVTWRMRLQQTDPGWVDLCMESPLVDSTRARTVLGWKPTRSSLDVLRELIQGIRDGAGAATGPLAQPFKRAASIAHSQE